MHFKKWRDILRWKNSEIEFLLLLCCLKQLAFFSGSFDKLKIFGSFDKLHQLC